VCVSGYSSETCCAHYVTHPTGPSNSASVDCRPLDNSVVAMGGHTLFNYTNAFILQFLFILVLHPGLSAMWTLLDL
jgi:hypothetical protein